MGRLFHLLPCLALAACLGGGGGFSSSGTGPDTVVVGDPVYYYADNRVPARASCFGSVCTITVAGRTRRLDIREVNPRHNPDIQVVNRYPNGVAVTLATGILTEQATRLRGYGAWAIEGASVAVTAAVYEPGVGSLEILLPVSTGIGAGTNPVSGSATWTGAMVGNRIGSRSIGAEVIGDARLQVQFSTATVDVVFTNIAEAASGAAVGDMVWRHVPMIAGAFEARDLSGPFFYGADHYLSGRFYGADHQEAGGVFERNQIAGAFHAVRN